jgi:uncharacterized protein
MEEQPRAGSTETPAGWAGVRKAQFLELLVFLSLIVPSMILSFFVVQQHAGFDLIAWATILRDFSLVGLILFFLWRDREPAIRIGWTLRGAWTEIGIGTVLYIPLLMFTSYLEQVLRLLGLSGTPKSLQGLLTPKRPLDFALAFLLVAVVALAEETMFRGYLILRLKSLTGSPAAAAVLSAIIFSVGHGYEGTAGVVTVGVLGLAFAIVYLWRGSLAAPVTMHFLQDFLGIIAVPLLNHK